MDEDQDLTHKLFTALGAIKKKPKQNLTSSVARERFRPRNRNDLEVLGNSTTSSETSSRSRSETASRSMPDAESRPNTRCKSERRNFDHLKKYSIKEDKHLQHDLNTMANQTNQSNWKQNSLNNSVSKLVNSNPPHKNTLLTSQKPKLKHFSNHYTQDYSNSKQTNFPHGSNDKYGVVTVAPEIDPNTNLLHDKSYGNKNDSKKYNKKTPFIGYKKIEELLSNEPSNIVSYLSQNQKAFDEFLKRDKSPDLLLLTMKLVAKICSCNFVQNKASILFSICNQDYMDQLCSYFARLPAEKDQGRKNKIIDFFDEVIVFYDSIVNLFPEKSNEILGNMFIITSVAIHGVERYQKMDLTDQKKKLETLETQLKHIEEDLKKKSNMPDATNVLEVGHPPNDFREISICPTKDDLFDEPFLRENIVRGRYNDVDHYLDVQFRLLREDFVGPLREGILAYKDMVNECKGKLKRIENIKVYPNVAFIQTKVSGDRVNYVVNFDPIGRFKKINWNYSKRFMFGSLLCFTNDNFNSLFFGTVANRDHKEFEAGRLTVQLEGRADSNIFSSQFIMVESEAYFESYYHVLKALQNMTFNSFPMMKYIIEGDINPITPAYTLKEEYLEYFIGSFRVPVLMESQWPTHIQLKLDESQHKAFKAALTNEFVVIQGPPGTGKTFLGLKIAKTLLRNRKVWNSDHTPLIVIAYTNHALDQFLEGILNCTEKLIRIGGQSKSIALEKYTLKEARKNLKFHKSHSFDLYRHLFHEMLEAMREIKTLQSNIDYVVKKSGVLPVSVLLSGGISNEKLKSSFYNVDNYENWTFNEDLYINWLQGDFEVQDDEAEMGNYTLPDEKLVEEPVVEDDEHDIDNRLLNYIDDAEDFDFEFASTDCCILKLSALEVEMKNAYYDYNLSDPGDVMEKMVKERNFNHCLQRYRFWKQKLENCQIPDEERVKRLACIHNLWDLSFDDRWALYWHCWSKLHSSLLQKMTQLEKRYEEIYRKHQEARQMADLDILRMVDVIGLTTSGAARLQSQLVELRSKIVIVEEAAEVLESHVVVSITKDCEHVILIGDHQQLRPSTSVFKLARKYKFDISLFERMICLGMDCNTLQVQHRMRPEIASLISPTIYPRLLNHKSVREYEHIKGVEKNLFFIDHNEPEEYEAERDSRKNTFEADFLISLCRYLLLQGYEGSEITILSTYSGQMLYLRQKWKQLGISKDVRISVVDNFQGEENKIILLSLVRSNSEANIGFLKIENRVCVALSRAKEGFYMIGNMDNLSTSSKIWPKIKETLINQNSLGRHLTLRCQNHSQLTQVSCSSDFSRVPEGGCLLRCSTILNCGHQCTSICHVQIERHARCYLPCERIPPLCPEGHPCTKKCFEECGNCLTKVNKKLLCGHNCVLECYVDISTYKCKEVEEVVLPACNHKNTKLCYVCLEKVRCKHECLGRLDCGHSCIKLCHVNEDPDHEQYKCSKPCAKKNEGCKKNHICTKLCFEECGQCLIEVNTSLPDCGHIHKLKCSEDLSQFKCFRKCKRTMQCGHPCKLLCSAPCGNCKVKVTKVIPDCGHTIKLECSVPPERKHCLNSCSRTLPCGHKCKNSCRLPCTVRCMELVPSKIRPACGHGIEVPCYMLQKDLLPHSMELLAHCQAPCRMKLKCDHICQGTCGSCWQGRLHILCKEKCGAVNICNHPCEVPCADVCPPCTMKCEFKCKHSRCQKKCCVPCTPCKELCEWKCKHLKCTMYCSDICNREPCYESCDKLLKCGHPCVGFCGEPCPRLCRTCDKEELTSIFLGYEDEDDARFIVLVDCKHTIESQGLEAWMMQNSAEVSIKTCPKCKTPIRRTLRFMNELKKVYQDIFEIKQKCFGNIKETRIKKAELVIKLATIHNKGNNIGRTKELLKMLNEELNSSQKSRNNVPSLADLNVIDIKANFLDSALKSIIEYRKEADGPCRKELEEKFNLLLSVLLTKDVKMPTQRVSDFEFELKRFYRFAQLCMLKDSVEFRSVTPVNRAMLTEPVRNAENIITSIVKYSDAIDGNARSALELIRTKLNIARRLNEMEIKSIMAATNLHKGHWYKCPNGHLYCVGECGRPMQMSRCPECGAGIGGRDHALLTTNQPANF